MFASGRYARSVVQRFAGLAFQHRLPSTPQRCTGCVLPGTVAMRGFQSSTSTCSSICARPGLVWWNDVKSDVLSSGSDGGIQLIGAGPKPPLVSSALHWENVALKDPSGVSLLPASAIASYAELVGVDPSRDVLVYDEGPTIMASRVAWILEALGHPRVFVLAGGAAAWLDNAPGSVADSSDDESEAVVDESASAHGDASPASSTSFGEQINPKLIVNIDQVLAAQRDNSQILDVRSSEEFSGENVGQNPRGGHVPGAVSLDHVLLRRPTHPFFPRSPEDIQQLTTPLGLDPQTRTITLCQSGARAAFAAYVLRSAGFRDVGLYDGSMHEWTRSSHPVIEG